MISKYLNFFPKFKFYRSILVGTVLAVALTSCSPLKDTPEKPIEVEASSRPTQTIAIPVEQVNIRKPLKIILDSENKESAMMDQEGGTLTLTSAGSKVSMTLPSSALFEENEISLTAVSAIDNLPISSGLLSAVQMGPEGMKFMQPVTVSLELPDPVPDGLMGFILKDDGQGFHFYPGEIIGNTFTFQVMHFSTVGVGIVTEADREAASSQDLAGMELAEEKIANLKIQGEMYGPYFEEIATILYEAYMGEGGIWEQLASAQTVEELKSVINDYLQWRNMKDWGELEEWKLPIPLDCGFDMDGKKFFCTKLDDFEGITGELIDTMLQQLVTAANKQCLEGDSSAEGEVFRILKFTDSLRGWGSVAKDDLYNRISDLKTCGFSDLKIDTPPHLCATVGDTIQLNAIATDSKGKVLKDRQMIWMSYDPEVASVSTDTGLVTINGPGSAFIEVYDKEAGYLQNFISSVTLSFFSLSGKWSVTEVANETACGSGVNTYRGTASISELGGLVTMTGADHGNFSGVRNGCSIYGSARESEDDGFSFGDGGLTISPDGNTISGNGSWTWIGDGEICSGTSSITFHR